MRRHTWICALACLLLAGCGQSAGTPDAGGTGAAPSAAPTDTADGGSSGQRARRTGVVDCAGSQYDPGEFASAPVASTLPAGPTGAVDDIGEPAFDPKLNWKVVRQGKNAVHLVRALDRPSDFGGGDVRTHERVIVERVFGAKNVRDGKWMLAASGQCTQRLVASDDLGDADLTLAKRPAPGDSTIKLHVYEQQCASGDSAEGRVELRALEETAGQVRVWVGVRPPPGDAQTCPSNPPTPFSIQLAGPLGDRKIVDASVVPARPVRLERR